MGSDNVIVTIFHELLCGSCEQAMQQILWLSDSKFIQVYKTVVLGFHLAQNFYGGLGASLKRGSRQGVASHHHNYALYFHL